MPHLGVVVANPGSPSAGDQALTTLFVGAGHTTAYVDDAAAVPGGFDAFVLSESSSPFSLLEKYRDIAVPVVCLEIGSYTEMGLSSVDGANTNVLSDSFLLHAHEITAGLPSPCQVRTTPASQWGVGNATLPSGAFKFASIDDTLNFITWAAGWAVDTGGALHTGPAPARRVALGYIDSWPPNLTANGQQLLLNAVTWAAPAGGGAQNVAPTAITSAEAFGPAVVTTGPVSVSPSSIPSAEAFGVASVTPGSVTLSPAAIASGETFGTPVLTVGAVTLSLAGIPSAEAFGTATLTPGPVTVSPSGIASFETFGTPTVTTDAVVISPTGIPSDEAFGTANVAPGPVTVSPTGIPSGETFGTPVVSGAGQVLVVPVSIPSAEAFGTPTLTTGPVTIAPTGIATAESFGTPTLAADLMVAVEGIASLEAFGTPVVEIPGAFTPALDPTASAPPAAAVAFTLALPATATTNALTATATTNGVRMKTGDLEPDWVISVSDAGEQADLNGVVTWRLIGFRGSTLVVDDLAPTVVIDPLATYKATVSHNWVLGETAHTEGFRLEGAVVATWPGGRPQTFPGHSVVHLDFEKALA